MGTKLAPAYTLFMGKLEHEILTHAPCNPLLCKPLFYKCYINDILILWPHYKLELNYFLLAMNSFHPSIKFTSESNYHKNYIFRAPTLLFEKWNLYETHQSSTLYIHAKSFHP